MRRATPYLILFAAVLLVYCPVLRNGLVWDDTALVLRDPLIRSPLLLAEGFRHFLFLDATAADFYRPLQRVLYTFDYWVAGFSPWIFHLTSLLVHAGAAMALYAFGRRWLSSSRAAFAAALLWAVHPVHTSAVAYISGLADPLAALLGFGGLALLLAGRWGAAGLCFGSALFAKESGAVFLLVGLGFAWEVARKEIGKGCWMRLARVAVPALVLAGLYFGLRLTAEHTAPPVGKSIPLVTRPVLVFRAVAGYAGLLAAPVNLRMERDVRDPSPWNGAQTLAGVLLVFGAAVWFWRGSRPVRACLLAAGAAYLPVSNLLALNATAAEHWVYVPSAFLFLAAAESVRRLSFADRRVRGVVAIAAGVWLVALGVRTGLRCGDWRDQESFLQATIRSDRGGGSSRMLGNLALLKLNRGEKEAAVRGFEAALARQPDQPFAMLGLARALVERGDFEMARPWLDRCEALPLMRASALGLRAEMGVREAGRDPLPLLREAVDVNPQFWPVRKQYIAVLIKQSKMEAALRELREVLAIQSFRAETWEMLGGVLEKIGQPTLAQSAYAEADRRDVWRGRR